MLVEMFFSLHSCPTSCSRLKIISEGAQVVPSLFARSCASNPHDCLQEIFFAGYPAICSPSFSGNAAVRFASKIALVFPFIEDNKLFVFVFAFVGVRAHQLQRLLSHTHLREPCPVLSAPHIQPRPACD